MKEDKDTVNILKDFKKIKARDNLNILTNDE